MGNEILANLSPELKLLRACARSRLDESRAHHVRSLLHQGVDWDHLLPAADRHGLLPLLYWHLKAICPDETPPVWMQFLRERFQSIAHQNLRLSWELHQILTHLAPHGLTAVPYRGPVLAAAAYGNPALRQSSDIDLLIHHRHIHRALKLLAQHGYRRDPESSPPSSGDDQRVPGQYLLRREPERLLIEFHTERTLRYFPVPLDPDLIFNRLQTSTLGGLELQVLSPVDHFILLAVHGTKHLWERLIWIADIAELLRMHQDADWEFIRHQAAQWGSERMLLLSFHLAREVLDAPMPELPAEWLQRNPSIARLAATVYRQSFAPAGSRPRAVERFFFRARARGGAVEGMRYALRLTTRPTEEDWGARDSQPVSSSGMAIRRIKRLALKYGFGPRPGEWEFSLSGFEPTPTELIEPALALAGLKPAEILYDLGCGDGRIVIEAARRFGARGVGIDTNPVRIAEARANAEQAGVQKLVRFEKDDMKTADLAAASVIFLYLPWTVNLEMKQSLRKRLGEGARIVSLDSGMGDWPPDATQSVTDKRGRSHTIYLWRMAAARHSEGVDASRTAEAR